MIIITDILTGPIDEGAKVATFNLLTALKSTTNCYVLSLQPKHTFDLVDQYTGSNKLLLSFHLLKSVRNNTNAPVIYIPEASSTLFSIIRAKILQFFTKKEIYLLALQPRKYRQLNKFFVQSISPKCIISQSSKTSSYLSGLGIKNEILPLGVDTHKYCQFEQKKQIMLRNEHNIDQQKKVILHVGHIQPSRNLAWLLQVKKDTPANEIIIVGSTYNKNDENLYKELQEAGIRIIREYTPNMEELYNIADYYIFPVLRNDGAIETPLSVIEAMACNLPIITTKFGSLPDTFKEDEDFYYVDSTQQILTILEKQRSTPCKNRDKITPFTWEEIARKLIETIEQ